MTDWDAMNERAREFGRQREAQQAAAAAVLEDNLASLTRHSLEQVKTCRRTALAYFLIALAYAVLSASYLLDDEAGRAAVATAFGVTWVILGFVQLYAARSWATTAKKGTSCLESGTDSQ